MFDMFRFLRIAFLPLMMALTPGCQSIGSNAATDEEALTNIPISGIRNQTSTGNCWLYATVAWAESLAAEGGAKNYSTAYLAYWNFFDQIREADASFRGVEWTGGSWGQASELILRYGLVDLATFTGASSETADSKLALEAMKTINKSLRSGALKTKAARSNPETVRQELNRAWQVRPELVREMNNAFGADGMQTFLTSSTVAAESSIIDPRKLPVRTAKAGSIQQASLADVIGVAMFQELPDARSGEFAWTGVPAPSILFNGKEAIPIYVRRAQRALNDGMAIPISWCVVDEGSDKEGRYIKPVSGTVPECGHETVITDYEVRLPDGRVLRAGEQASDADKALSLDERSEVLFLRMKNSWGTSSKNTNAGYTDIYPSYYMSQVKACTDGEPCQIYESLLSDMTLPPGY
jgi:hypothetical protein